MSLQATEVRIYNWAAWARAGGSVRGLGYKSPALWLLRDAIGGDRWNPPSLMIGDDEGIAMDAVITRLREREAMMHLALCLHYIEGKSFRDCAKAMNERGAAVNHQHVAALVQRAVSWVDGCCDGIRDMAA